jgi:hypothetical protein
MSLLGSISYPGRKLIEGRENISASAGGDDAIISFQDQDSARTLWMDTNLVKSYDATSLLTLVLLLEQQKKRSVDIIYNIFLAQTLLLRKETQIN